MNDAQVKNEPSTLGYPGDTRHLSKTIRKSTPEKSTSPAQAKACKVEVVKETSEALAKSSPEVRKDPTNGNVIGTISLSSPKYKHIEVKDVITTTNNISMNMKNITLQIRNVMSLAQNGEVTSSVGPKVQPRLKSILKPNLRPPQKETIKCTGNEPTAVFGISNLVTATAADGTLSTIPEYMCNFCQAKTQDQSHFLSHILSHIFVCNVCSFQAFSRLEVINHVKMTHPEKKESFSILQKMELAHLKLQKQEVFDSPVSTTKASTSPGTPVSQWIVPPNPSSTTFAMSSGKPHIGVVASGGSFSDVDDSLPPVLSPEPLQATNDFYQDVPPSLELSGFPITIEPEEDYQDRQQMDEDLQEICNAVKNNTDSVEDVAVPKMAECPNNNVTSLLLDENFTINEDQAKVCTLCNFSSRNNLLAHIHVILHNTKTNQMKDQPYQIRCGFCIFKTKFAHNLANHMLVRHPEQPRRVVYGIRDANIVPPVIWICPHCGYVKQGPTAWSKVVSHMKDTHGPVDTLKMVEALGFSSPMEHMFSLTVQSDQQEEEAEDIDESQYGRTHAGSIDDYPQSDMPEIKVEDQHQVEDYDSIHTPHGEAKLVPSTFIQNNCGGRTVADVLFLKDTPPDLQIDLGEYYTKESSERGECKICAYVSCGSAAISHMREHVMSKHTCGKIWGCPYCSTKKNKRNEIVKHVLLNHKGRPLRIVRRKPYELQHHRTHSTSVVVRTTPRVKAFGGEWQQTVWQCPLCSRQDKRWSIMAEHAKYAHPENRDTSKGLIHRVRNNMDDEILEMEAGLTVSMVKLCRVENLKLRYEWDRFIPQKQAALEQATPAVCKNAGGIEDEAAVMAFRCHHCQFTGQTLVTIQEHLLKEHKCSSMELLACGLRGATEGRVVQLCAKCSFSCQAKASMLDHLKQNPTHMITKKQSQLKTETPEETGLNARNDYTARWPGRHLITCSYCSNKKHGVKEIKEHLLKKHIGKELKVTDRKGLKPLLLCLTPKCLFTTRDVDELSTHVHASIKPTDTPKENILKVSLPKFSKKTSVSSKVDNVLLQCKYCKDLKITGSMNMKRHMVSEHKDLLPVATDVKARLQRRSSQVHLCPVSNCTFQCLVESQFNGHMETFHKDHVPPPQSEPEPLVPVKNRSRRKKTKYDKVINNAIRKAKTVDAFKKAKFPGKEQKVGISLEFKRELHKLGISTKPGKSSWLRLGKNNQRKKSDKPYIGVDSVKIRYKCIYCEDFLSNDVTVMRNHVFSNHTDKKPEVRDLRKRASRQKSRLYLCPLFVCNFVTYDSDRCHAHRCDSATPEDAMAVGRMAYPGQMYRCDLCKMILSSFKAITQHLQTHGNNGFSYTMLPDPSISDSSDQDDDCQDRLPGSTLFPVLKQTVENDENVHFPDDPEFAAD